MQEIVVSAATRAMLGDHFDLEDLGAYELKGFAEPVPVWRVLSARDVESRFAATRTGSSAPLVGGGNRSSCPSCVIRGHSLEPPNRVDLTR